MAIKKVITVCPYCASGCKINLLVENNKIVGAEGAMKVQTVKQTNESFAWKDIMAGISCMTQKSSLLV